MSESSTGRPFAGTAVVALGGNALAPGGERSNVYDQFRHTRASLGPIVDLVAAGWNVCVVHGNGPQVGDELVRNELARYDAPPLPLGVLVAAYVAYGLATGAIHAKSGVWGRTFRRDEDATGYWSAIAAYALLAAMLVFLF